MLQQSSVLAHLFVTTLSPKAKASLLDEWTWLIGIEKRARLVTACGDIFVEDSLKGTVHFLDVSAPELSLVAETKEAFEALLVEPSFIDMYLHPERVEMLRAKGLLLKKDQVYSFCTPLSLGGQISADNIDVTDVEVHFSIAGQIESQIADVPVGAPITDVEIRRTPRTKSWWKFW
jgi:hypothetical protein